MDQSLLIDNAQRENWGPYKRGSVAGEVSKGLRCAGLHALCLDRMKRRIVRKLAKLSFLEAALSQTTSVRDNVPMKRTSQYRGCHFPPEIITHAVWLYCRFTLSYRDVEELLAKRGVIVSYETIRRWCLRFGPRIARNLRKQRSKCGDTWFIDEVFVTIGGRRCYLWRAIDQEGDVIDILLPKRRNGKSAKRFFRKLLKAQQRSPNRLVTDKLGSYRVAHRDEMAGVPHDTTQYANNLVEASHRATREQERQMKRFRRVGNAQRFLELHAMIRNLTHWGRHALSAASYRQFRTRAFDEWSAATCV